MVKDENIENRRYAVCVSYFLQQLIYDILRTEDKAELEILTDKFMKTQLWFLDNGTSKYCTNCVEMIAQALAIGKFGKEAYHVYEACYNSFLADDDSRNNIGAIVLKYGGDEAMKAIFAAKAGAIAKKSKQNGN